MRVRLNACLAGNIAGSNGKAGSSVQRKTSTSARSKQATTGNTAARQATTTAEKPQVPPQWAAYRAAPDLVRLERYRRRATSRPNRAIREFIFIRSLREFHSQAQSMHDHGQDAGRDDGSMHEG
jgi:hypothetical protein